MSGPDRRTHPAVPAPLPRRGFIGRLEFPSAGGDPLCGLAALRETIPLKVISYKLFIDYCFFPVGLPSGLPPYLCGLGVLAVKNLPMLGPHAHTPPSEGILFAAWRLCAKRFYSKLFISFSLFSSGAIRRRRKLWRDMPAPATGEIDLRSVGACHAIA